MYNKNVDYLPVFISALSNYFATISTTYCAKNLQIISFVEKFVKGGTLPFHVQILVSQNKEAAVWMLVLITHALIVWAGHWG